MEGLTWINRRLPEIHMFCEQSEGYAVLGEVEDLDMNLQSTTSAPASTVVRINHEFAPR